MRMQWGAGGAVKQPPPPEGLFKAAKARAGTILSHSMNLCRGD